MTERKYEPRPWNEEELHVTKIRLCDEISERIIFASEEVPLSWFMLNKDCADSWFGEYENVLYKDYFRYWYAVADMVIADWDEAGLHVPVSKARQIVETERKLFCR